MAVMPERRKASRVIKRFQCNGTRADLAQPRLACVAYEGQEHGASRDEMAMIAWHAESVPIPPGKNDRAKRQRRVGTPRDLRNTEPWVGATIGRASGGQRVCTPV